MDIFLKELYTIQISVNQKVDDAKSKSASIFNHKTANGCRN